MQLPCPPLCTRKSVVGIETNQPCGQTHSVFALSLLHSLCPRGPKSARVRIARRLRVPRPKTHDDAALHRTCRCAHAPRLPQPQRCRCPVPVQHPAARRSVQGLLCGTVACTAKLHGYNPLPYAASHADYTFGADIWPSTGQLTATLWQHP